MRQTQSAVKFGIQGYSCAKVGLRPSEPNYTIPKDENTNFFKHVTRVTRHNPAPTAYQKALSWKTANGAFSAGNKRKTFTDEAIAQSKKVPSSAHYKVKDNHRILYGNWEKAQGVDYLSDCQYMGKSFPGPTTYKINIDAVRPKSGRIVPWVKPSGIKNWKPKKAAGPAVGSYEEAAALRKTKRSSLIHQFGPAKAEGFKPKETFTTI